MTQNELVLRPPIHSDLPAIAALLTAEGFGDDNADRLCTAFDRLQTFSLVALRANRLAGVLLATFNGWHVFASHLVIAPSALGEGIGKLLIRALRRSFEKFCAHPSNRISLIKNTAPGSRKSSF
jgi:GNAT superfamily N-acetyltransferase